MAVVDKVLDIVFGHSYQIGPGVINEKFGKRVARNVFLSETAISKIEEKAITKIGEAELYHYGKNFGYNYAYLVDMPKFNILIRNQIFNSVMYFFETTYGQKVNSIIDWDKNSFEIHGKNVVICRKNGIGITLSVGGWAGLLAYLTSNKKINGKQIKCTGKGDSECIAIFSESKDDTILEKKWDPRIANYNQPMSFSSEYSLELFAQFGLVKKEPNAFDVKGERFFPIETSYIFGFEELIKSEKEKNEIIYTPTFEFFKSFAEKNFKEKYGTPSEAIAFTTKFFSALGWGIIQQNPVKRGFIIQGFPWRPEIERNNSSTYFLAAFNGFLSGLVGKLIEAKIENAEIKQNRYDMVLVLS